jgi:Xaa-Pro aminopeptidase
MHPILTFLLIFCLTFNLLAQSDEFANKKIKSSNDDLDLLPASFHQSKRDAIRQFLPDSSVAIFFSNSVTNRSNDVDYPFHQNPDFYYLTGLREPDAVLFIFKEDIQFQGISTNEILFLREIDNNNIIWNGKMLGTQGAKGTLKIKQAYSNQALYDIKLDWENIEKFYIIRDERGHHNDGNNPNDLFSLKDVLFKKFDYNKIKPNDTFLKFKMAELREIKSKEELKLLVRAIDITVEALKETIKSAKSGMKEYEFQAMIEYYFKKNGAESWGFPSICGSGENGCILHYINNRKTTQETDLIILDVGAEYHGYTADITRTIPVKGTFSKEQKIIYDIVLEAQNAGIAQCKPGNKFWAPHKAASAVIEKRLRELGLIENTNELRRYFMHGTSHYLGLDVHDAGTNNFLRAGNVITVEPGIYIPEGSPCDKKWWNIGVRIEDDILITEYGHEILSGKLPRKSEEIENLIKEKGFFE